MHVSDWYFLLVTENGVFTSNVAERKKNQTVLCYHTTVWYRFSFAHVRDSPNARLRVATMRIIFC